MHEFKPGDRVHFDGDRAGTPIPRDDEEYEAPAWGTVATAGELTLNVTDQDRTPVRWDDDGYNGYAVTAALTICLVPAAEAPESDPKES